MFSHFIVQAIHHKTNFQMTPERNPLMQGCMLCILYLLEVKRLRQSFVHNSERVCDRRDIEKANSLDDNKCFK